MRSVSILQKILRASVFGGAFVVIAGVAHSFSGSSAKEASSTYAWIEASAMPKVGPTWQRAAPVSWSSRFNVRWEARWSSENKYMV